ncbi:MAG: hypothetical protein PHT38_07630, partial [Halothiobacillus sp.]|nr:hypothetical protein [Halothiobacillus sp.]
PFGKGGQGGFEFAEAIQASKSPSFPLFQRGKRNVKAHHPSLSKGTTLPLFNAGFACLTQSWRKPALSWRSSQRGRGGFEFAEAIQASKSPSFPLFQRGRRNAKGGRRNTKASNQHLFQRERRAAVDAVNFVKK